MRPRTLAITSAALVAGLMTTAAPAAPAGAAVAPSTSLAVASSEPSQPPQRDQMLYIINAERARAGVAPLALRTGVAEVAREWAAQLAREGGIRHRPDLGDALRRRGVSWRAIGENVGRGGHVSDVHRGFMASSSHRATLLSGSYSEVGIGVTASGGLVYVTVDFVGH